VKDLVYIIKTWSKHEATYLISM